MALASGKLYFGIKFRKEASHYCHGYSWHETSASWNFNIIIHIRGAGLLHHVHTSWHETLVSYDALIYFILIFSRWQASVVMANMGTRRHASHLTSSKPTGWAISVRGASHHSHGHDRAETAWELPRREQSCQKARWCDGGTTSWRCSLQRFFFFRAGRATAWLRRQEQCT